MKIHLLTEGQTAVRLDYRNLPDLDDLMVEIARFQDWEDSKWEWDEDEPTRIASDAEPRWQWTKISPCWCGEHGWHWDSRSVPDEKDLLADRPRGKFVAMEWY